MLEFVYHINLKKEIAALEKRRFRNLNDSFIRFERLCEKQFHPTLPQQVITPAKLHRVKQNDVWTLWKGELIVPKSGLRPNQWPRIWFVVKGSLLVFLCIGTHMDNYDDNAMDIQAISRLSDYF